MKVRTQLFNRGVTSTGTIIRACARADYSGNKQLDRKEFDEVLKSVGVFVSSQELGLLFRRFDKTGDGNITYDEFLTAVKGDLTPARLAIVEKAFSRIDKDGSGSVSLADLRGLYNAKKHPEVIEGKKTEDQVLTEFLSGMEGVCGNRDGIVTLKEFIDYYTDLSASIPTDGYFVTMMESAWMIQATTSEADDKQIERFELMLRDKIGEKTHGCESDAHALERVFRFYDRDGSGQLTIDEFGAALLNMGLPIERRLVGALFDRYDPDHSGTLSYTEFSSRLCEKTGVPMGTSIL